MSILDSAAARWTAVNYSGSGNWLDEIGSNDFANAIGTPLATFVSAGQDSYFDFDGTDTMDAADDAAFSFGATDPFTVIVRTKVDADPPDPVNAALMSHGSVWNATGYRLGHNTGPVWRGSIYGATSGSALDDTTLSGTDIVTVALVRNVGDDDTEVFLDGVGSGSPTADATVGTLDPAEDLTIGGLTDAAEYKGRVYGMAIWGSALTDAQVLEAHNHLTSGIPSGLGGGLLLIGAGG